MRALLGRARVVVARRSIPNPTLPVYLNRVADLLYVVARAAATAEEEVPATREVPRGPSLAANRPGALPPA